MSSSYDAANRLERREQYTSSFALSNNSNDCPGGIMGEPDYLHYENVWKDVLSGLTNWSEGEIARWSTKWRSLFDEDPVGFMHETPFWYVSVEVAMYFGITPTPDSLASVRWLLQTEVKTNSIGVVSADWNALRAGLRKIGSKDN